VDAQIRRGTSRSTLLNRTLDEDIAWEYRQARPRCLQKCVDRMWTEAPSGIPEKISLTATLAKPCSRPWNHSLSALWEDKPLTRDKDFGTALAVTGVGLSCQGSTRRLGLERTLGFPFCYVSANHFEVLAGGFDSLFGIVARHKSSVITEGQISLPPETIKDCQ